MRRRDFLKTTGVFGAYGLTSVFNAHATANPASKRRINILFLMDDQHRGDCIGAAGADWVDTPNLDRLASEGALFSKAYSSLPSCLPARTSLLTGKSPWAHGVLCYAPMAPEYVSEKPSIFTKAGYRTHSVGKTHFGAPKHGYETVIREEAWRGVTKEKFECDYRKWFKENHPDKQVDTTGLHYTDHRARAFIYDDDLHPTNWTAQRGIDFLESYDEERPWFLKVSFKRPHPPFDPPKRLLEKYNAMDFPMPKVGAWAEKAFGKFTGRLEEMNNAPRGNFPKEDIHQSRAAYYAAITHVDEQVGRVIEALKKRGELENTLILFTADHGDMMGDNHLWRKTYAYEGSARVPMIVRWPESLGSVADAKRGQVIDRLVELRDVLPTFLDAADIPKHPDMDGMSMLGLVRGKTDTWRTVLDLEHGTCYWKENAWVALTDGRYKYIYFTLTGQKQLFDVEKDPGELHDLAPQPAHAELLSAWRKRMTEHLSVRGEPWVHNGDLAVQRRSIKYGPNHGKS